MAEEQKVVDDGEKLLQKCFEAVTRILGRKPENSEIALVNSLFIYVTKEIYFRGRK